MTLYIYRGPYSIIEFDDHGVKKLFAINEQVDIEDDAFIEEQIRRGFHNFERVSSELGVTPEPAPEPEPAPPA